MEYFFVIKSAPVSRLINMILIIQQQLALNIFLYTYQRIGCLNMSYIMYNFHGCISNPYKAK